MDLRDDIPTNLADLAKWLRQVFSFTKVGEQPSAAIWAEMCQGGLDRADYLEGFVIDRVERPTRYLALAKFEPPLAVNRQEPELIAQVAGANDDDHAPRPATDPQENIFDDARLSESR